MAPIDGEDPAREPVRSAIQRGSARGAAWLALAVVLVAALAITGGDPATQPGGVRFGGAPTATELDLTASELDLLRAEAIPLVGSASDYDALLERIGDAGWVLIGDASHGTHEFYRERAKITERLIAEKGFDAVAVEADWPAAAGVDRYVRGLESRSFGIEALEGFGRWPQWMWRNTDVLDFVTWLREHNERVRDPDDATGFYGLDLYSIPTSIEALLQYLEDADPAAAARARARYACFDRFGENGERYGSAPVPRGASSCAAEAAEQFTEMQDRVGGEQDCHVPREADAFGAMQNARVVRNAVAFYQPPGGDDLPWNIRDRHMAETLDALAACLGGAGTDTKIVVWAHNSHLGDARATEMASRGQLNLGQLVREAHGEDAVLIGTTTHRGTVLAASAWEGPVQRKEVRPALDGSYESVFHAVADAGAPNFMLSLRDDPRVGSALGRDRPERAIGVLYLPETERWSHYFDATSRRAVRRRAALRRDARRARSRRARRRPA